jgi:hypothetical protein
MGKLGALIVLLALAAAIYYVSQKSQIQETKKQQTIEVFQSKGKIRST